MMLVSLYRFLIVITAAELAVIPDSEPGMTAMEGGNAIGSSERPLPIVQKYPGGDFTSISNLDRQCPFGEFSGTLQWIPDQVRDDDC